MSRYISRPDLCNVFFAVFAVLWFITRLGIYPYKSVPNPSLHAISAISFGEYSQIFVSTPTRPADVSWDE